LEVRKREFFVHAELIFSKCSRSDASVLFDGDASKLSARRAISSFFESRVCANASFYGVGRFSSRLSLAVIEFAGFVFSRAKLETFLFFVNEKVF
jgi:hypothetical protein